MISNILQEKIERMVLDLPEVERRIHVAYLMGWKNIKSHSYPMENTDEGRFKDVGGTPPGEANDYHEPLPEFSTDLNATSEMEDSLTDDELNNYDTILWNLCHGAAGRDGAIHATAEQRVCAYLVLKNPFNLVE